MRRIGIDVGGTNTDAVLLDDGRVIDAVKTPTTPDITTGIITALADLVRRLKLGQRGVDGVVIGTTHFVNAVVQRRNLTRVAAVRIGLPASAALSPFCDWPPDLAECGASRGGSGRAGSGRSGSRRSSRRSTRAARKGRARSSLKVPGCDCDRLARPRARRSPRARERGASQCGADRSGAEDDCGLNGGGRRKRDRGAALFDAE
jgi:Hydantoinase/oxoprolinase N-terminal region